MKEDIHPEWYPEAKVIVNGKVVMTVGSTQPEMNVEIWSGTHPFFTGEQRLIDTEGQVDRFMRRLQRREAIVAEQEEIEEASKPENVPTSAIGMSSRAEKALIEAGLENIAQVMDRLAEGGDDALLSLMGFGQKALIDTKRFIRLEGFGPDEE